MWVRSLGWEDPLEKGNGNPHLYSYLGNPMDRGAWRATVHRVAQRVEHDWATTTMNLSFLICKIHFLVICALPAILPDVQDKSESHPSICIDLLQTLRCPVPLKCLLSPYTQASSILTLMSQVCITPWASQFNVLLTNLIACVHSSNSSRKLPFESFSPTPPLTVTCLCLNFLIVKNPK